MLNCLNKVKSYKQFSHIYSEATPKYEILLNAIFQAFNILKANYEMKSQYDKVLKATESKTSEILHLSYKNI